MNDTLLDVCDLTKNFGSLCAVDSISFSVKRGEIIGLLGPNGAGKTTTIDMLLGLTKYDSGRIRYFDMDFRKKRSACLQRINFTSAYNSLQTRITVLENLHVFAHLYQVKGCGKKIDELLDYFEINHLRNQNFLSLSAGQKTRVNLVKSLINDPEIVLMDEPTASLDPDIADKTLSLIEELREQRGIAVLYTSHNMSEIARICDSVIFLDHGRVAARDTPTQLTRRIPNADIILTVAHEQDKLHQWCLERHLIAGTLGTHAVRISVDEQAIGQTLSSIGRAGFEFVDIEIRRATLDDVFLNIARGK